MKLEIYCYRDKKLGAYTIPFINNIEVSRAPIVIGRAIADLDSKQKSKMIDYDLYHIGSYDDKTGIITSVVPEFLLALDSIIIRSEEVKENGKQEKVD